MDPLFSILVLANTLIGFGAVVILTISNTRFTKGDLQKIISGFIWGTIFMFSSLVALTQIEFFPELKGTIIDIIRYVFMLIGFSFYFYASYKIYTFSKVMGFASEDMPKKLKRVLKS